MDKIAALIVTVTMLINGLILPPQSYAAGDVWITDKSEMPDFIYTYYETSFGESYVKLPAILGEDSDINAYIRNDTYDRYERVFTQFENSTYDGELIWHVDYKMSRQVNGLNTIVIEIATGYSGEEFDIVYYTYYYEIQHDIVLSTKEYLARFGYAASEFIAAFQTVAEPGFTPDYWGSYRFPYIPDGSVYMLSWDYIDWIAFDEHNELHVQYHTTDRYKNPIQVKVPIENTKLGDMERLFNKAFEAYWLLIGVYQPNGLQDQLNTIAKLRAYLEERFTPELTDVYMEAYSSMFTEIDGELQWSDGLRGWSEFVWSRYFSISEKSDDTVILTERMDDAYAGYDADNYVPVYKYSEYEITLVDGEWRFNTFIFDTIKILP